MVRPISLVVLWLVGAVSGCGDDTAVQDAGAIDASDASDAGNSDADASSVTCGEPATAGIGEPCRCVEDCEPGLACLSEREQGVPGGECVQAECTAGAGDCMGGTRCISDPTLTDQGGCRFECASNDDCRAVVGVCNVGMPGGGVCFLMCQDDADCPVTGFCDRYLGLCGERREPTGADTWEPCLRHDDCRSRFCANTGRCGTNCSVARQGCPEQQVCVELEQGNDFGLCFRRCDGDDDCPDPELACVRAPGDVRVCGPAA